MIGKKKKEKGEEMEEGNLGDSCEAVCGEQRRGGMETRRESVATFN